MKFLLQILMKDFVSFKDCFIIFFPLKRYNVCALLKVLKTLINNFFVTSTKIMRRNPAHKNNFRTF